MGRSTRIESSGLPVFSDVSMSTTPGNAFHPVDELLAEDLELLEIGTVDHELDRGVLRAAAADDSDLLHRGADVRRELRQDLLADHVHDDELIAAARLDRLEPHVDGAEVARFRRVAGDRHQRVVHLGQLRAHRRGHAVGQHLGRLETGAFGRAQVDFEFRCVVLRHEVLVGHHEERHARQQHQHRNPGHDDAMGHGPLEHPRVEQVDRVEDLRVL